MKRTPMILMAAVLTMAIWVGFLTPVYAVDIKVTDYRIIGGATSADWNGPGGDAAHIPEIKIYPASGGGEPKAAEVSFNLLPYGLDLATSWYTSGERLRISPLSPTSGQGGTINVSVWLTKDGTEIPNSRFTGDKTINPNGSISFDEAINVANPTNANDFHVRFSNFRPASGVESYTVSTLAIGLRSGNISYGTPEPATIISGLLGLAGFALRKFRKA